MGISFNNIPTTLRVPFTYVEFDASKAQQGPSIQPYKILALGQQLAAGTKTELGLDQIFSAAQAKQFYGVGSHLAQICEAILANNKVVELTAISIDDDASTTDASGTVTFSGSPTAVGDIAFYIAARRITIPVTLASTPTTLAAALDAEITADTNMVVTSSPSVGVVTLTAKNGGTLGNQIDVRVNHNVGEETPAGVSIAIVAMASGATDPDVAEIIAVMPETHYNLIVSPWTDTPNMAALQTEMNDRDLPTRQLDGRVFTAKVDTVSNLGTLGNGRNDRFLTIMGAIAPTPPWIWSGAYAGSVAAAAQVDPARPFQTLELTGVLAPLETERFTLAEKNTLLFDGIATHFVSAGGVVRIQRGITTYKLNDFGSPDTAFLDLNVGFTLSYLRYDFRVTILNKYSRHKLANDGTQFGAGQVVMTPKLGKAEALVIFRRWETLGLVEGFDQFSADLIVERNAQDPNRLDFLLSPDVINQLRVVGAQIQFRL